MKYLFEVNSQNGVTNFCTLEDAPVMKQMGVDVSTWIEIETEIFNEQNKYKIADNQLILLLADEYDIYFPEVALSRNKKNKLLDLEVDFNKSKKITIQNGKTLIIEHDTPERDIFLELIEQASNLSATNGAFIYKQKTDAGSLALRILPEIAAYIFQDLFLGTLGNPQQTQVPSRIHNKTTVYDLALEKINNAATQTELDAITWNFLHPSGVVIDVNDKAIKMLADPEVSDFAKAAINAAKDPITGEIHLVKTLQELAADS